MDERPLPPAAIQDPASVEMLRAWIANKGLHCSMKVGMYASSNFTEEKAWGILLADVARHVANALMEAGLGKATSLAEIMESFADELRDPTSEVQGEFTD